MNHRRTIKGFTLIEVVLSIAVASGIALAVFTGIRLIDSMRSHQERVSAVRWEADLIMAWLRVRISDGVDTPGPQETTDSLVLSDGATIGVTEHTLHESVSGTTVALSSSRVRVSSVSFSDRGSQEHPGLITVGFTLTASSSALRVPFAQTFTTTFYAH